MCLSNASKIKIAKKDIVCWVKRGKEEDMYISPFYRYRMKLNKIYKANEPGWAGQRSPFNIYGGYFHLFKQKKGSRGCFGNFIVKAIIPKGTEYYEGESHLDGIRGYASKKLKLVKEV